MKNFSAISYDNKLDVSGEYIGPAITGRYGWTLWFGTIHIEYYDQGIKYAQFG